MHVENFTELYVEIWLKCTAKRVSGVASQKQHIPDRNFHSFSVQLLFDKYTVYPESLNISHLWIVINKLFKILHGIANDHVVFYITISSALRINQTQYQGLLLVNG